MRRFVRAVIANATITGGAGIGLVVDPVLLRAADLRPYEEVELVNLESGERFSTFVQAGEEGSGEARVHRMRRGDVVAVLSWALLHDGQTLAHRATLVTLDAHNRVVATAEDAVLSE